MIPTLIAIGFVAGLLHRHFGAGPMAVVGLAWALVFGVAIGVGEGSVRITLAATGLSAANALVGGVVGAGLAVAVSRAVRS